MNIDPKVLELLASWCEDDNKIEREMDCVIATTMFGGTIEHIQNNYTGDCHPMRNYPSKDHVKGYGYDSIPHYTTSIDAASSLIPIGGLIESQKWTWWLTNVGYTEGIWLDGKAKAIIYHPFSSGGPPRYAGVATTPARALAAAALRAQAAFIQEEKPQSPMEDQQDSNQS